jgi:hypothetical protein
MANAELNLRYFLGDTVPIEVALRRRTLATITDIDLTGATVVVRVGGLSVPTVVATPANGKITFRLNAAITVPGAKPYSIVITYPNGDIQTHTKGVVEAARRAGEGA